MDSEIHRYESLSKARNLTAHLIVSKVKQALLILLFAVEGKNWPFVIYIFNHNLCFDGNYNYANIYNILL